jgi:hypothetical protein
MCWVKDLFFDDDEWVLQFHPPKDKNINIHPYVLHLWSNVDTDIPTPPRECV